MMKITPIRRQTQPSEEGFVLLAVIFLVVLLTIALAVALPKVSKEIQRDREMETMQRGKQYIRGVRMYYKKFGAYPPNVDALVKPTNNIRFLRKKYADPTTGKEDWKPIMFGQNKAPTAMGFFGQPLGGSSIAGVGPGASGNGLQGNGLGQTAATADASASQDASSATATTTTSTTGQTGQTGLTGKTFGGAGIIGFSPNSPKQSIMVYKKKNHYNEWEFVYDPITEQMMSGGNTGTIGQPASSTTTPIGGTSSSTSTTTTPTNTSSTTPTTTP
jgi:type II secretory pathway pseudopilin PulG